MSVTRVHLGAGTAHTMVDLGAAALGYCMLPASAAIPTAVLVPILPWRLAFPEVGSEPCSFQLLQKVWTLRRM